VDGETHTPWVTAGEVAPLVGRDRELAQFDAALAEARTGRGRLFLVLGEPGIGKTRLAEAVASRGEAQGMLPLWGRAWESAGAPAYWPWTQLLRSLAGTRDTNALEAELGLGARWLVQVLPELSQRMPGIGPPRTSRAEKARFALFDAVASFLRDAAASDPLVIVLDDLHAADPASLLMFEFLAHGVTEVPILLLATAQEAAARTRPEVERLIGALGRACTTILLRGFGEEELARIVEHRTGLRWPPSLVTALRETTEGNPFFTTEVLQLVTTDSEMPPREEHGRVSFPLPDTVRETVRRRFESLDPQVVEALEVASVIGREFRVATVAGAASEEERLIGLLDEAVAAGLVTEVHGSIGRYRFTHNLIRETLYTGLTTTRRVQLHRTVAEAIEDSYGEAQDHLAELAHHYAQASPGGDAGKALEFAVKAGHGAMRLFAYEQAAELFELALEMSELSGPDAGRRAELLLALGRARGRADRRGARETLIEAGDAARTADDPRLMAEAGLAMRAWPLGSGVLDEQPSRLLDEALTRLDERDRALRARVMARLAASLYYWAGTERRRAALVEDAVALAREEGDPATLAHVLSNGQIATWGPDYTERDLVWMQELLLLIEQIHDDELELITRNRHIDLLVEVADLPAADAALRALELTMGESSDARTEGYVCLQRARHAIIEGRYPEAERLNAQAARVGSRLRDTQLTILAANQLASVRWVQGRFREIEPQIREMMSADVTAAWPAALARVCCESGREAESRRVIDRLAAAGFARIPRYNGFLVSLALLSEACIHLGDTDRAEQLYGLLLPFAERNVSTPQAVFAGPVSRFLGILAAAAGKWDVATSHFRAAREAGLRMNASPVTMRVALDEAHMLLTREESGDRERAIEPLGEAGALAAELGVDRIAEEVDELRTKLGRPGRVPADATAPSAERDSATLRCEGEMWAFDFGPRTVRVRDSKGVRHLALLLSSPGVEIHAAELAAADSAGGDVRASSAALAAELDGVGADDAGPVLDAEAKAAYRNRLEDLREDLEEAESFNDPERASRARTEMDFLEAELTAAVGLGGRDRKAASTAERARVSVTKAIRATIRRISKHDPMLGRELEGTVRTGIFCVHEPDPRHPLVWRVDGA
jgi:tetratricopeptide (TPR) repeat protein